MEKDEKEKLGFFGEDRGDTDPGVVVPEEVDCSFEEAISQKGDVVFEDEKGGEPLRVPIELKVNISCIVSEAQDGRASIITAIACPVFGPLKKVPDRVKDALIKYYMEVMIGGRRVDVLNEVLRKFYRHLACHSAKFEIQGSDDIGFESVAARLGQKILPSSEYES
jgi:hypothetical protein